MAFPIPKANDIVTVFSHLQISFRSGAFAVSSPVGGIAFYTKYVLERICDALGCQISDIIEYKK